MKKEDSTPVSAPTTADYGFPQIGVVASISSASEVVSEAKESPIDLEAFEDEDYKVETQNAKLSFSLSSKSLEGKSLEFAYTLEDDAGHTSADFLKRFVENADPLDWSKFSTLNLVCRPAQNTRILRVCLVEEDGDWWNFINTQVLESDKWYWIQVPLEKMFAIEGFPIKGDGKQDLSRVAELRIIFDRSTGSDSPGQNTLLLDRLFLA